MSKKLTTSKKFKIGDKVRYVTEHYFYDNTLVLDKIYTVDYIFDDYTISVEESAHTYWFGSFITLKEERKQKIKKLNHV